MAQQPIDHPPLVHLPTRASDLRAQAAALVETAREKAAELQDQAQIEAETLLAAADLLDRLASGENGTPLRAGTQEHDSLRAMKNAHKLAISAAHSKSRLAIVVGEAGYSLRDFAALPSVDVPESTLRSAHAGTRAISEAKCLRVQHVLGKDEKGNWRFPATKENWPGMEPTQKK